MEVKLYLAESWQLKSCQEECLSALTEKRRTEAESFVKEEHRLLHCAAGLLLRCILGVREDADLRYGEYGKPELVDGDVHFSLSHAGHYAVLAVGDVPIGVDIEPVEKPQILPRKMLHEEELGWLANNQSAEDFCLLWTRLESALKADGCGLALEKREFSLLENAKPWHWETQVYDDHMITCAAECPITVQIHILTAEQLLHIT